MIQNYIDTHAHIFSLEFHDDFDAVIARAHDAGVYCETRKDFKERQDL